MTSTLVNAPQLTAANVVRMDAAAVRRELRAGELTVGQALEDPRSDSLTVEKLLLAVPGIGRKLIPGLLRDAGILGPGAVHPDPSKRVGHLTDRQRRALAVIGDRHRRRSKVVA